MELARDTNDRDRRRRTMIVECVECSTPSGGRWTGWRAYRVDDPEVNEPPQLAFYCPTCALREFGGRRR
ncbi:MAG TPA: hypothetical protein VGC78_04925 [Gaiellaceae bacterium]|jgi:NADH:ubiquinone oxidoreductase subunit